MSMGLFFKRLLMFFVFALFSYFLLLSLFSLNIFKNKIPNLLNLYEADKAAAFRDIHLKKNTDILFVGSSHAEFDPVVFRENGINAINLSVSSLRPFNTFYLLKNEVPAASAKVIAIECYFGLFNEDYFINEAAIGVISNENISPIITDMAIQTKNFRVINSEIGILVRRIYSPLYKTLDSENKGELKHKFEKNAAPEMTGPKVFKRNVTHKAFEYLQQSMSLLKLNNKIPLLIMAPVTKQCMNNSLNYSAICFSIDSIAQKNGIVFLNYNDTANYERINLDDKSDFIDDNHLSESGEVKFSNTVAKDLIRLHIL